ncbi:hypothetical protein A2U01_0029966, partial [Trifolium medium]|nr:hypothetical protein [Trifolium medium]
KATEGKEVIKGSGKGLLLRTNKGMSSKLSENISGKTQIDSRTLAAILDQKPYIYKETFLPKPSSPETQLAHSSGVIFTAMQQSGTSEPSVQVKSNPDVSRLSRVLNQQEISQPEIATTSGSDKPDFVKQQFTNPQQEKALVSDTAVLSDISIQQQQQPEKTLVSKTMPIQPDANILTTNVVPPVNDTVDVMPTQQVETIPISKPEPKLKEVISSEPSIPEEEEKILHFDIRNISPEPMPEPLSF